MEDAFERQMEAIQQDAALQNIEDDGRDAFDRGRQPEDCPYNEGTKEYKAWMCGYVDADAAESGEYP